MRLECSIEILKPKINLGQLPSIRSTMLNERGASFQLCSFGRRAMEEENEEIIALGMRWGLRIGVAESYKGWVGRFGRRVRVQSHLVKGLKNWLFLIEKAKYFSFLYLVKNFKNSVVSHQKLKKQTT